MHPCPPCPPINPPVELAGGAASSVWRPDLQEARKKDPRCEFITVLFLPRALLPFSCQLGYVKPICAPASLPPLKPPLGSPSFSLALAFDVSDRHMVAGLSPSLLVHHLLFTMAAVPEGRLGLEGEMSPPFPHFRIFQAFLAVKLLRLFCHLCIISREMLGVFLHDCI